MDRSRKGMFYFFFTFINQVFFRDRDFTKKIHQTPVVHHVLAADIVICNGFKEEKPHYFDKLYCFIILIWSAKFLSSGVKQIFLWAQVKSYYVFSLSFIVMVKSRIILYCAETSTLWGNVKGCMNILWSDCKIKLTSKWFDYVTYYSLHVKLDSY